MASADSLDGDIFDTQPSQEALPNGAAQPAGRSVDRLVDQPPAAENAPRRQGPQRQLLDEFRQVAGLNEVTPEMNPNMATSSALQRTPLQTKTNTTPEKNDTRRKDSFTVSPIKSVSRKRSCAETVKTIVFFDFETTGLFSTNVPVSGTLRKTRTPSHFADELNRIILNTQNDTYPKITEMSFVAVPRETYIKAINKMHKKSTEAPATESLRVRVPCNIHTRQVNPVITEDAWGNYELTRSRYPKSIVHEKYDLSLKNDFLVEWMQVRTFLDSCPKPVCLVAHNGIGFDYRVLFGELYTRDLHKKEETTVPREVLFIDSMLAAQNIEDKQKEKLDTVVKGIDWRPIRDHIRSSTTAPDHATPDVNGAGADSALSPDHPLNFINKAMWTPAQKRRWTAANFKKNAEGQWELTDDGHRYGLGMLYNSIVKGDCDFHYAQDDSEALLQICLAYGEEFLDYMDSCAADLPF